MNVCSGEDKLLDDTIEELTVKSQCYLFGVLCGSRSSAGYRWASANGAPVEFVTADSIDALLGKIVKRADFLICYNDGTQYVKRLIMMFKSAGKGVKVVC